MHPFTKRIPCNFNAKLCPIGTHTHTLKIFVAILQHCDTIATPLLHNCHTVAQAQHCRTIATVMFMQQCCKIVTPLSVHLLFFCPICFCSTFVLNLGQIGTKRERGPPSGGQLFYSPVRPFRGVF